MRRGLLLFGLLALVGGVGTASNGSAATPPSGVHLASVSCAGAGNCSAGGYSVVDTYNQQAFVVDEANGVWGDAIEVPGTAALNSGGARVRSVSCAAAGECAAGGDYYGTSNDLHAFVVDQTNGVWGDAIEVPGLATLGSVGDDASVVSVSCAGAGECAAGGYYTDASGNWQPFLVDETNGVWGDAVGVAGVISGGAGFPVPGVPSVSCAAAGECAAGGTYVVDAAGHVHAFVVDERNGVWGDAIDVPGTAALSIDARPFVLSMSCGAAGECAVGGNFTDGSGFRQAFVADEKNGVWGDAIEVPGMAALNSAYAVVWSVSCAAAGDCVAGGAYDDGSGSRQAFVVDETNGVWGDAIEVPGTAALNSGTGVSMRCIKFTTGGCGWVTTVSCVAAGECAAGGFYTDASGFRQGFVVAETGGVWSDAVAVSGTPDLGNGGDSTVVSVSCGAVGECAAGGYAGLVSIGGGQPTRTGFATQQADDASFVVVETNGVWCSNAIGVSGAAVRSYPVTYVGNGATGGSAPSGGSCPHVSGATVTVLGNGSFTRAGYTFAGWNTQADGSGAAYQPGDEFSMPASAVTLYAQWKVAAPEFLSSPVVSGTAAVGSQLSTTTGSWANGPTGYLYRWQRCSNTGSSCVNIVNATGSQYTLVLADAGHEVRSEALASNAGGPAATGYAPSAPTGVIARKPAVITLPKLSGIARVGLSLSVTNGTWKYSPTGYAYQWLRCTSLGASCRKIAGATSSSYVLTSGDAGHRLKAKVTASNAAGSVTATTSNTSATVKK